MNATQKVKLIGEVYQTVFEGTESFEVENVGADLAYVLGAIAKDSFCEFSLKNSAFIRILLNKFKKSHPVWKYTKLSKNG